MELIQTYLEKRKRINDYQLYRQIGKPHYPMSHVQHEILNYVSQNNEYLFYYRVSKNEVEKTVERPYEPNLIKDHRVITENIELKKYLSHSRQSGRTKAMFKQLFENEKLFLFFSDMSKEKLLSSLKEEILKRKGC